MTIDRPTHDRRLRPEPARVTCAGCGQPRPEDVRLCRTCGDDRTA